MEKEKKQRKKTSRNVILLALFLVIVGSVGAYAWFSVSNRARVENLALIADHQGNLQIADDLGNGPGTYSDVLDLTKATGASNISNTILSPVTTKDGVNFYLPNYNSLTQTVESVSQITNKEELTKYYIYEKTFYLKAGAEKNNSVATINRTYDIALYGVNSNNKQNGCYIYQPTASGDTAANSIRVSFTLENGQTFIYEPNCDVNNSDDSRAIDGVNNEYGRYSTYKQKSNGLFLVSPKTNESEKLFTINENVDVKVTMRIWIEGTDIDCTNSIAADTIAGQIQFVSTEVKN
ncbi:MAG: hypothetical protein IJA27_07815 [Lachnospiraceae bacterium]|nr:hypothetical protein [Lachnospiraceae bacterium]